MRTWQPPRSVTGLVSDLVCGLRRRLVAGSALLLCAGSCLNPQPDPFPQNSPTSPGTAASGNPGGSEDTVDLAPSSAQTPPPRAGNTGAGTAETAPQPLAPESAPPGDFGGDLDAGAPPPADAEAPDANPPANGLL